MGTESPAGSWELGKPTAGSVPERSPGAVALFGSPARRAKVAWFQVTGDPMAAGLAGGFSAAVPEVPPAAACSSPGVLATGWLLEGGWPAASKFRPLEATVRSSLARPWDFFRDKAWLSQSSSSFCSEAPSWEGWLALAGEPAPLVGSFAGEEEGSPAGAECRPGAGCWFAGAGTEGVDSAEPPR